MGVPNVASRGMRLSHSRLEVTRPSCDSIPQRNSHAEFPVLKIRQGLIDLIVAIRFRYQALEFDSAGRRHLEHFLDIVGLPARHARDGDLARDEATAADGERAVA